jgi:hypothetical protein
MDTGVDRGTAAAKKHKNTKQDTLGEPITSFLRNRGLLPVLKENCVLLAAAGGALAGAAIATLISSEKGQEVLTNATQSAKDWAAKSGSKSTAQKTKKKDTV